MYQFHRSVTPSRRSLCIFTPTSISVQLYSPCKVVRDSHNAPPPHRATRPPSPSHTYQAGIELFVATSQPNCLVAQLMQSFPQNKM
mmetsp:Transcript_10930/g.22263  ORF Transcript_10930/g.22263 Transcript_10930/m.22263 type:complete len:86 (+) Transcript_10930:85-342(+)